MRKISVFLLCALIMVACSKRSDYAQIEDLLALTTEVNKSNIVEAVELISKADLTTEEARACRESFEAYLCRYADEQCERLNTSYTIDKEKVQIECASLGVEVYQSEGFFDYYISPHYISLVFSKSLTEHEKQVLELQSVERCAPAIVDGEIAISYQEIQDRLFACDALYVQCNDSLLLSDIEQLQQSYLGLLVFGSDNTPAFDYKTNKMTEEAREAVLSYIATYPGACSKPILEAYAQVLAENGFECNEAVSQFIKQQTNIFIQ